MAESRKPRVLLLCGGQSEEHEVSLASARSVVAAAGERFDIKPLIINRAGQLLRAEASARILSAKGGAHAYKLASSEPLQRLDPSAFDVVFPLLHGPFGEDGSVQGLLKLMKLPFVGSDVLGSAVGMDKLMMKAVFAAHGLPQVPYKAVSRSAWLALPDEVLQALRGLPYPVFVKPANLGSSVGISKAEDEASLREALSLAAQHDRRIIVEAGLSGARELEVGVLGNDAPSASVVGEIRFRGDFYDYSTKYTEGCAQLDIPAHLPEPVAARCRQLAVDAFLAVDAAGLARVDFFLAGETLYLNEINTMPGFTATSMYPKLWEETGVPYGELIERLLELGLEVR